MPLEFDSSVDPGAAVYDEQGRLLGYVSGVTEDGFETEIVDPSGDGTEEIPGQEFGEGHLMWRCTDCGEMDDLGEGLPQSCPGCNAAKEAITVVTED